MPYIPCIKLTVFLKILFFKGMFLFTKFHWRWKWNINQLAFHNSINQLHLKRHGIRNNSSTHTNHTVFSVWYLPHQFSCCLFEASHVPFQVCRWVECFRTFTAEKLFWNFHFFLSHKCSKASFRCHLFDPVMYCFHMAFKIITFSELVITVLTSFKGCIIFLWTFTWLSNLSFLRKVFSTVWTIPWFFHLFRLFTVHTLSVFAQVGLIFCFIGTDVTLASCFQLPHCCIVFSHVIFQGFLSYDILTTFLTWKCAHVMCSALVHI